MSEMAALDSWVVSCVLCGEEIEAGARGQGTLRYHCQDMDRTDIDERCYKQFTAVRKALECPAGEAAHLLHTCAPAVPVTATTQLA